MPVGAPLNAASRSSWRVTGSSTPTIASGAPLTSAIVVWLRQHLVAVLLERARDARAPREVVVVAEHREHALGAQPAELVARPSRPRAGASTRSRPSARRGRACAHWRRRPRRACAMPGVMLPTWMSESWAMRTPSWRGSRPLMRTSCSGNPRRRWRHALTVALPASVGNARGIRASAWCFTGTGIGLQRGYQG